MMESLNEGHEGLFPICLTLTANNNTDRKGDDSYGILFGDA